MSYIIIAIAVLIVLHIYMRIGQVHETAEKALEETQRIVWDDDDGAHFPGNVHATIAEEKPKVIGQYKGKWITADNWIFECRR